MKLLRGTPKSRGERLKSLLERVQLTAVRNIMGLHKQPGEPGYNPDATATWAECSVRTRCDLALVQGAMAAERAKVQAEAPKMLGVVAIPVKIESTKDWEAFAEAPQRPAIEAVASEKRGGHGE